MKNDQIAEKIAKITAKFQSEINPVKKMIIIHKYMDFLKTDSKLKMMFEEENNKTFTTLKSMMTGTATFADFEIHTGKPNFGHNTIYFYCFLDAMYKAMEGFKEVKDDKKRVKKFELDAEKMFSSEITNMTFVMAFGVLNKKIFNKLSTEDFISESKNNKAIYFDSDKSVLFFKGEKIKIKRKADLPLEHYILETLFDNEDKVEEIYYQDIAEDKLKELNYNNTKDWKKYYRACKSLQDKVRLGAKVDDFVIFTTGKTGNVRINKKYLDSIK